MQWARAGEGTRPQCKRCQSRSSAAIQDGQLSQSPRFRERAHELVAVSSAAPFKRSGSVAESVVEVAVARSAAFEAETVSTADRASAKINLPSLVEDGRILGVRSRSSGEAVLSKMILCQLGPNESAKNRYDGTNLAEGSESSAGGDGLAGGTLAVSESSAREGAVGVAGGPESSLAGARGGASGNVAVTVVALSLIGAGSSSNTCEEKCDACELTISSKGSYQATERRRSLPQKAGVLGAGW